MDYESIIFLGNTCVRIIHWLGRIIDWLWRNDAFVGMIAVSISLLSLLDIHLIAEFCALMPGTGPWPPVVCLVMFANCAFLAGMILCIALCIVKALWKHLALRFRNRRSQPINYQTILARLSISPPSISLPLPIHLAPSTSQNQSSHLIMKVVYVWEFLERDDYWLPFDRDNQEELEDAYFRKFSELRLHPKDGQQGRRWSRVVSFADMTQRNEGSGKVRKIQRRELKMIDEEEMEKQLKLQNAQTAPCSSQLKQFPPGALFPLKTLAQTASLERCELSKSEPDFDTLVKIFQESMTSHRKSYGSDEWCPKPMVEVIKIDKVVNPFKQRFYEAAQDEVASRNPSGCGEVTGISAPKYHPPMGHVDLNEYFLFHGTNYDSIDQIIEHGLDPQRGGDSAGALFGIGTYFAENASKSDFYTTCDQCVARPSADGKCHHPTGMRCMIVAQVLLGKTYPVRTDMNRNRLRAHDREDGKGPYDSHTALKRADGGCVDHMEFIIFKEQRALVRFVIFYKHQETCQCKDCLFRRGVMT